MMKKAKGIYYILWLLIVNFYDVSKMSMATQTTNDINKYLSRLNKTPLKSIKSLDGDIIDCVHVSRQPAFDHPLLKNHTIQMRPSNNPEGLGFDDGKSSRRKGHKLRITQLWHLNGKCSKGSVPIRRIKEEDLLRANSLESFGTKKHDTVPMSKSEENNRSEYAVVYISNGKFYGAKANISIWNPKVEQPLEDSSSQLWISSGYPASDANVIEAGWMVSPNVFGDHHTRLFIYWTRDNYQSTGCFNLLCSGFIQTSSEIAIGSIIKPISTYGGSQFHPSILVWKDPKDGNWWLQLGNKHIGYWPSSIFTYLADSASQIDWGGRVLNSEPNGRHTTSQMGSGHFPKEGFRKASVFGGMKIVDNTNTLKEADNFEFLIPTPNCYNGSLGKNRFLGTHFYYGGPGRNPNCP